MIDRHNYEAYFLLYIDNELNKSDKELVESFIQANPGMQEELEMLKNALLKDESFVFENKELLYKKADSITLDNYETYFLLFIDGELSQDDNEEVEKFVLQHPDLQNQFVLLKQSKLYPQTIPFYQKEKLYKKEGNKRIVPLVSWLKIGVAASVLAIVAIGWYLSHNDSLLTPGNSMVISSEINKTLPSLKKRQNTAVTIAPVEKLREKIIAKAKVYKATGFNRKRAVFVADQISEKAKSPVSQQDKPSRLIASQISKNNLPSHLSLVDVPAHHNNIPTIEDGQMDGKIGHSKETPEKETLLVHTVYHEINTSEEDDQNTFYIGSAQINKNKLKGLFKKAARLFNKNDNDPDDEKSLRIAGFKFKSN